MANEVITTQEALPAIATAASYSSAIPGGTSAATISYESFQLSVVRKQLLARETHASTSLTTCAGSTPVSLASSP